VAHSSPQAEDDCLIQPDPTAPNSVWSESPANQRHNSGVDFFCRDFKKTALAKRVQSGQFAYRVSPGLPDAFYFLPDRMATHNAW
jgi:hypothetical protein